MTTNVDTGSAPRDPTVPRSEAVSHARRIAGHPLTWRAAPVLAALAIGVVYLIAEPRTRDLAAATFRARLFGDVGFTLWNGTWYAGHPTWSYSVLVPPLAWLLSPPLLGAASALVSAALFEPLARRHFGARGARWGALWFGAAAATPMLSGRMTFSAGVAAALGAALAVQRGRPWLGCGLAILTGLLSPVAALFLALAGLAYALAGSRRVGAAMTIAALAGPAVVSLVFPDGREGPFVFSAFWPVPLFALAFCAAAPARERALRIGAALYGAGAIAVFLIPTPLGGNLVRFGALVGGPLLLCALLAGGRRLNIPLVALLVAFGAWQWSAALRDIAETSGDPSTQASYYRPLNDFLAHAGAGHAFRVEIPFTFSHWETAEVSPRFSIARGWLRTDDVQYNHLFYGGTLNAATYRSWLTGHGVRFVAVPHAEPDYSARAELRLIAGGLPYLKLVWSSRDWRVFEVAGGGTMVSPARAKLVRLGVDDAALRFDGPGAAVVRIRWSPYWRAPGACVERAGEWTRVIAKRAGEVRLAQSFSLGRVFDHGRRCA